MVVKDTRSACRVQVRIASAGSNVFGYIHHDDVNYYRIDPSVGSSHIMHSQLATNRFCELL